MSPKKNKTCNDEEAQIQEKIMDLLFLKNSLYSSSEELKDKVRELCVGYSTESNVELGHTKNEFRESEQKLIGTITELYQAYKTIKDLENAKKCISEMEQLRIDKKDIYQKINDCRKNSSSLKTSSRCSSAISSAANKRCNDLMDKESHKESQPEMQGRFVQNNAGHNSRTRSWISDQNNILKESNPFKNITKQSRKTFGKHFERDVPRNNKYISDNKGQNCMVCNGFHAIWKCFKLKQMNSNKKWDTIKKLKLCVLCLKSAHPNTVCEGFTNCGINGCVKRHNRLLHKKEKTKKGQSSPENKIKAKDHNHIIKEELLDEHTTLHQKDILHRDCIALQTVPVVVKHGKKKIKVNAILVDGNPHGWTCVGRVNREKKEIYSNFNTFFINEDCFEELQITSKNQSKKSSEFESTIQPQLITRTDAEIHPESFSHTSETILKSTTTNNSLGSIKNEKQANKQYKNSREHLSKVKMKCSSNSKTVFESTPRKKVMPT